ncbi:MAG: SPASM domain-containing protein [Lachnospiraceae bacterium]|nr:SPASM domain-containing protein [Lachnospiraceae bacterium]
MVHLYENNGLKIALDVNSGAIHLVDEMAYKLIPKIEELIKNDELDENQITGPTAEILELYHQKMLFTPDTYEDYINEVKDRETVVKALCLHVAHDCNLACRYCFAEKGEYGGNDNGPKLMSLDVGKRALDFLVTNSGNRHNLEVDFFGGEPLLNWEMIKELVTYGRSLEKEHYKNFRFTLTTNGILLNEEMFSFINQEISNVVLSIDGRKEVNDRMRPLHDGRGSYDLIIEKFIKLAESRNQADYYVRGTFTRENLDFTEDVKHLANLGFKQISIEPMISCESNLPKSNSLTELVNEVPGEGPAANPDFALCPEDVPAICAEYDRLAKYLLTRKEKGQPINFFHFMIDLTGGPCAAKRLSGCGAGSEYLAVTPGGDLYPCHQFVGQPEFLMGNISDGITKTALYDNFKATNVYTKPKCRDCFAKFYCSGGCAANAYKLTGDLNDCDDLACDLQRKRVECAIMLKCDGSS